MQLKVTYDWETNALYVYLVPIGLGDAVRQEVGDLDVPGTIVLDFDRANHLIGIEVLGARELLPKRLLDGAVVRSQPK